MAEKRRIPLNTAQRAKAAKKIAKMKREEKSKPKDERRSEEQIVAIAMDMVREGRA
jgi:chorismate mutase